jgi:hypothetical protein
MENTTIIIRETKPWIGNTWSMTIDIKALAEEAGKRHTDLYEGRNVVDYPIPRAKKLLKLIRQYGDPEDFGRVGELLKTNKRLSKYWNELEEIVK